MRAAYANTSVSVKTPATHLEELSFKNCLTEWSLELNFTSVFHAYRCISWMEQWCHKVKQADRLCYFKICLLLAWTLFSVTFVLFVLLLLIICSMFLNNVTALLTSRSKYQFAAFIFLVIFWMVLPCSVLFICKYLVIFFELLKSFLFNLYGLFLWKDDFH